METTPVIIVGAGPAGLALGLALGKFRVHSVILEREKDITTDPRGVFLTGDTIRILYDLGIGDDIFNIGHEVDAVNFHHSSFKNKPFLCLNIGTSNALEQAVPEGVLQIQPRLESVLRKKIQLSRWCELRTGCEVTRMLSEEPPTIEYTDRNGTSCQIKGQWLIGADGKVGIVRKHFLEPVASIKQEVGTYPYEGTWVAANLHMSLPTQQTHPEFPLWRLGFTPQEVYDLFWPKGWHFCSPPGAATASGRFGPHDERLWRHEFRQDDWDDGMDAEALMWEHITPMITREEDTTGRKFGVSISYPRDCIEVLRCRPFRFAQKVVNRWFHKRTVLIGDAAHVFPPFAGQGIASGVRDAHQLAWRLALLLNNVSSGGFQAISAKVMLQAWALERRRSVDDVALFTMLNGRVCNDRPAFWILALLWCKSLAEHIPFLPRFTTVRDGFLLKDFRGGARLAQIHVQSSSDKVSALSDTLLHRSPGIFTLIVISKDDGDRQNLYQDARTAILGASFDPSILSEESIVLFNPHHDSSPTSALSDGCGTNGDGDVVLVHRAKTNASGTAYMDRLGQDTKFAIVRPDFFVFACARDRRALVTCLQKLTERIYTH
ncbi:hypothetical protein GE09DRAFT_1032756 [Coniochaeta sp. 2T2.1]|nr:hypothetical protein GE09DRAFT_1032756 [Coniochaeta sp. 2T2.1]